jgi:KUP system potassium uptake protein
VLLHHLKHNKVLHQQVVLLSILAAGVHDLPESERISVTELSEGFWRVKARYGFMETPDVPNVMSRCADAGIEAKPLMTTYYLGRESLILDREAKTRLTRWRKVLYIFMSRNSRSATQFFQIPPNRVVELGAQLKF